MRCTACNRPLLKPFVIVGRLAMGPKCARRAGLTLTAARQAIRRSPKPQAPNPTQQDLFDPHSFPSHADRACQGQMAGRFPGALPSRKPAMAADGIRQPDEGSPMAELTQETTCTQ